MDTVVDLDTDQIVAYSTAAAAGHTVVVIAVVVTSLTVAEPSNLAFVDSIAIVAVAERDQDKAAAAGQCLLLQIQ